MHLRSSSKVLARPFREFKLKHMLRFWFKSCRKLSRTFYDGTISMNVQSLFLCYPQVHCQYFMSIVREQRTWQHFLSCHSQIHVTAVVYKDAFNTHFFQLFPIQDLQVMWVKRLSSYLFSLKSFLPSLSLGHRVFQERKRKDHLQEERKRTNWMSSSSLRDKRQQQAKRTTILTSYAWWPFHWEQEDQISLQNAFPMLANVIICHASKLW